MLRSLLELKPRDVPTIVALRNTAAVVVPLAVGVASGRPGIGLGIAVGALNTMFSDQPGPYRMRLRRMLLAALAAGLSALVGFCVGDDTIRTVLATLVWGVGGGLLVALGPDAARIGLTSMILLIVTAADPRPLPAALGPVLLISAGGILQLLFSIAAWPLRRYRPERRALARLCRQLAADARRQTDAASAPAASQALSEVEELLYGADRARGATMDALRVLAEIIERIRLELAVLDGLVERLGAEDVPTLARIREYAARALETLAAALEAGTQPLAAAGAIEGLDAGLATLADAAAGGVRHVALAHGRALAGALRAALRNADLASRLGERRQAEGDARLARELQPREPLPILRANLRLSSVAMRHAIRCGVCLALATLIARSLGLPHGQWMPMTTAIVLKPDFAGTFRFGLLRVVGTLLGLALTTALVHFAFGGTVSRIALLAVLCFGFRSLTTVHYAVGIALLTSLIVTLLSLEGEPPAASMLARAIGTVLGSALALLGYLVWPTWEHLRYRGVLADLLDAYRRYFCAILEPLPRIRAEVRRATRAARSNAEVSLERLRQEPRRDRRVVAMAEDILAHANRFLHAAMALEAMRQQSGLPQQAGVVSFVRQVDERLAALARCLRRREPPPEPGPALRATQTELRENLHAIARDSEGELAALAWSDGTDRITDSVDALDHLLRRDAERGTR